MYRTSMRYTLITMCALLVPACSSSKEKPSADNEKPKASEAPSAQSAKAPADETLPDWSELFASGLCPLSGDEIQAALGLAEKVSTKDEREAAYLERQVRAIKIANALSVKVK